MRLVVSLTTIPGRLRRIYPVLRSLIAQSEPFDAIYLNLTEVSRKGVAYELKEFMNELHLLGMSEQIIVNIEEKDSGPSMKLLPTLKREREPETRILTVDDDMIFSPSLCWTFKEAARRNPNSALSLSGWIVGDSDYEIVHSVKKETRADWIQGTTGILYKRAWLFDDELEDYSKETLAELLKKHDDHWFSIYLAKKGIPRIVIPGVQSEFFTDLETNGIDAISQSNSFFSQVSEIGNEMKRRGLYTESFIDFTKSIKYVIYLALCLLLLLGTTIGLYFFDRLAFIVSFCLFLLFYCYTLRVIFNNYLSISPSIKSLLIEMIYPCLAYLIVPAFPLVSLAFLCCLGIALYLMNNIQSHNKSGWTENEKEKIKKELAKFHSSFLVDLYLNKCQERYSFDDALSAIAKNLVVI